MGVRRHEFQKSFTLWWGEWIERSGCGVLLGYYRSGPGNDGDGVGLSGGNEDGKKEKRIYGGSKFDGTWH